MAAADSVTGLPLKQLFSLSMEDVVDFANHHTTYSCEQKRFLAILRQGQRFDDMCLSFKKFWRFFTRPGAGPARRHRAANGRAESLDQTSVVPTWYAASETPFVTPADHCGLPPVSGHSATDRLQTSAREACGRQRVGMYSLRRLLGSGGMGEVYLAEHRLLNRPCAVKLIRGDRAGDRQLIARFEIEVQTLAKLSHPNTVEIYDYGLTDDGVCYYVMEFLPGLTLQDIVDRTGPLPAGRVIDLLRQVCAALGEAHRHGIVHRDVKPANIVAAERGGVYDVAKLLDFGLAKSTQAGSDDVQVTRDGALVGSPLYAAPELTLSEHDVDPRTDIYSLGATEYYLLTGRPVFSGEKPLQIVFAHAHEAPVPPSEIGHAIPPELEAIVLKCLAKSPEDRFASAADLEAVLASCARLHPWTGEQARRWWRETADFTSGESPAEFDEFAATSVLPVAA